jgi:hypothetical protein
MGLSIAISGGIIMIGMTYLLFSLFGITNNIVKVSDSSFEKIDLENEIKKTSLSIISITTSGTSSSFSFNVQNDDLQKLWEFDKFDVIVTYDFGSTTYTEYLTYQSSCPAIIDTWCINTFNNDVVDPKILNQYENMQIDAQVINSLKTGGNIIITISTQNGVVATRTATV